MKTKRLIALVMVVLMLSSCFLFACDKEDEGGKVGSIIEGTAKDESEVYDAQVKDLGGHEFRFIVRGLDASNHLSVGEVYAEAPNGDKVNDAVFSRNAQLAEKYNCTIVEERQGTPGTAVREPLLAGEYVADYIATAINDVRSLAASNLLVDMSLLDNMNLEKAWYDQNAVRDLNIGGKVFYINGDCLTLDDRAAWIMFFNKDWVEGYKADLNLYDEVKKGTWTIDLMYEIMVNTVKDLNGDGVLTPGTDRMGYIGEPENNWFHVVGCGETLSKISSSGDLEIPATPKQSLLNVWEKLRPLLTSPTREVSWSAGNFRAGLGTFFACNVGTMLSMSETAVSVGVLPLPKLNAEQDKYYNGVSYNQLGVLSIPTTTDNCEDWETNGFTSGREQAAYFLEAYSYYSMLTLTPAFYDQVILKQSIRDLESAEMVELAMENKVYDSVQGYRFAQLGAIFAECGSGEYGAAGTDANYDTFVSTYESRVMSARKGLQSYIEYINTEAI